MNLVARLHHLLFEVEEDLGEAGLLFGQREDGLVDDLQAERGADAFAMAVGDVEANARVGAGPVDGGVGGGLDLQFVGGLDEDEAMVGDRLRIAAEEIGVDVESAGHLRAWRRGELGLAVLEVEIAGEDGLAVLDDVHVGRAASARGEDLELDAVAGLDDGAVGAQQNLVGAGAGLRAERLLETRLPRWSSASMRSDSSPEPGLMRMTATPPLSVETADCAHRE